MNCYTTVYDFADFTDNAKVDSSVILDKMFLDFDAHGEPLENAGKDFISVHKFFVEQNILQNYLCSYLFLLLLENNILVICNYQI